MRQGEAVRGPFPAAQIGRYAILGRVRLSDEVSTDGRRWARLADCPDLVPPVLREGGNPAVLERLRAREDERSGVDRRAGQEVPPEVAERRSGTDRRRPEPVGVVARRLRRTAYLRSARRGGPRRRDLWLVLGGTALLVAGLVISTGSPRTSPGPRCNSEPVPGVDWHECRLDGLDLSGLDLSRGRLRDVKARGVKLVRTRLQGADLAYADLTGAQLGGATLAEAVLVGANLRGADLSGTDLTGADLSYGDLYRARLDGTRLGGVRLDRAVWVDGRLCRPASVGRCDPE
jgi:hypothetical protein